jgi:hypothetical protein
MSIPAGIPAGQIGFTHFVTKHLELADDANSPLATVIINQQANVNSQGIPAEEQGVAYTAGPKSFYGHTIQAAGTTLERLIIT